MISINIDNNTKAKDTPHPPQKIKTKEKLHWVNTNYNPNKYRTYSIIQTKKT